MPVPTIESRLKYELLQLQSTPQYQRLLATINQVCQLSSQPQDPLQVVADTVLRSIARDFSMQASGNIIMHITVIKEVTSGR